MKYSLSEKLGLFTGQILLPTMRDDLSTWAILACDQYTSDTAYWDDVKKQVADTPSTLNMVLPEVYLNTEKEQDLIASSVQYMQQYLSDGTLEAFENAAILIRRHFADGTFRTGLVATLDLEQYDYHKDSTALVRATEGTIEARIPPRLKIREHAPLELPHIMILIDDIQKTFIEALWEKRNSFTKVYDSKLGFGMGHIEGYLLKEEDFEQALLSLDALYGLLQEKSPHPMLYAMGDGNHSFATAKTHWNNVKQTLSEKEQADHPARFALCEVVNIHDEGLLFEPIHRVVFSGGGVKGVQQLVEILNSHGMQAMLSDTKQKEMQNISYTTQGKSGVLSIANSPYSVEAGTIDFAIEKLLEQQDNAYVDYIHGDSETLAFATEDHIALLLPVIEKAHLFDTVSTYGPLPQKSFSMGDADEKRCYLEAKQIIR